MTHDRPTLAEAKDAAKRLRAERERNGAPISHAEALEIVARQQGFRDWNAFHAAARPPRPWSVGDRAEGHYLSQPFAATVVRAERIEPGWFRLELNLDEAVDVVTFAAFSNMRKRIRVAIGPDGYTRERTSNGEPHARVRPCVADAAPPGGAKR